MRREKDASFDVDTVEGDRRRQALRDGTKPSKFSKLAKHGGKDPRDFPVPA